MTDSVPRAPEAAMELLARALEGIDALLALAEQPAPPPEIALAALAALRLAGPLSAVQPTAELLTAYGRRRWREGWRACEARHAAEAAGKPPGDGAGAPLLRLVSSA